MESEDELDELTGTAASSQIERRRIQREIFDSWIISAAGQNALSKVNEPKTGDLADEEQSMHSLMANQQDSQIIRNPRDYQIELFERAKRENTIAVLDTGSGKTLISVLLLRWMIDKELEDRAAGKPAKISFFLVASVTLAYQQASVLEANLDHKVARVCGADNVDIWSKAKWLKLFSDNKVIVCTADILCICLRKSFIAMKQISLLIFDEAHHAKKNHAYARILKDYYLPEPSTNRPRIFGMTASPIDAKTDVTFAANDLETLLDSKIATTLDMSLRDAVKRPTERILAYAAPVKSTGSPLLKAFKARFEDVQIFKQVVERWTPIAQEMGTWCADQYLLDKISDKRLRKYESSIEKKHHAGSRTKDPRLRVIDISPEQDPDKLCKEANLQDLDDLTLQLKSSINFVQGSATNLATTAINDNTLSSKVTMLWSFLALEFERETSHRCIVFVQQRIVARLLEKLFRKINIVHLRPTFLIGGNTESNEDSFSFRQQVITLIKFRKGEYNCLFATSVAEEGLDVPDCNLVVRFDVAQTMIQYVQSRGRARSQHSKFVHMVERGNTIHSSLVNETRYQEMAMRKLCQTLPEDRRLVGNEDKLEALLATEKGLRVYIDPTTGAKLTYMNALECLATFVAAIPHETGEPQHPTYVPTSKGSKTICEVLLPGSGPVPIRSAIGRPMAKKILAKRSAAFEACIELRKRGYLDDHLLPTYQKKLPAMRNALLAAGMDKMNQYLMRTKPSVWAEGRGSLPQELWVTIIDFPGGLEQEHQALALLTRKTLPTFPTFPVYLSDGRATTVISRRFDEPIVLDDDRLTLLSTFTFRIFKDVFSKTYQEEVEKLSYWLAPANTFPAQLSIGAACESIDWSLLREVYSHDEYPWTPHTPAEALLNRFLIDRWDGSRKFCSIAIEQHLRPQDPVPEDAAKHKYQANILDYSVSLWKTARATRTWDENQPVMRAMKYPIRRNMLASPDPKEMNLRTVAYLCPEPLRISALPPAIVATCFVWPAIIHRFESYMIALEACELVGVQCDPVIALEAVTKDSDNTGEHDNAERIHFQKGMGDNYERLEFIGDTFLKTATTISTFIQNPNDNEFDYHVKRMRLLCNLNLYNVAVELGLFEYIRSLAFSRRIWYPEGLQLLVGKGSNKQEDTSIIKRPMSDKTIADVSEALIGAAFVTHDRPGEVWHEQQWQNAVCAVTKLTTPQKGVDDMPMHSMMSWDDYRAAYQKPDYQIGESTASQRDLAEKVQLEQSYVFKYPRLLRSAFIHPSQPFLHERLPNYQRLEFLGDALLDLASITHIFYRFPDKDPGWLTEHKMAMVSNKFLGAVCVTVGFHKHLRHCSTIIEHQVTRYVAELSEARQTAGASRDYWTTVSDPPKCLPDIVESFVGAMFIDSDFDFNVVQGFFDQHMKWYFEDMSPYDTFANSHPCTHLHNLLDTTFGCSDYRLMAKELPSLDGVELDRKDVVAVVMIHNEIMAHSKGKSGRYAKLRAANNAIEAIEGLAPYEFRARFGCNCHLHEGSAATALEVDHAT